jgi:hypothetical protein
MRGLAEGETVRAATATGWMKATVARGWPGTAWLRVLLVAYGTAVCAVGAAHLQAQLPDRMTLMDSRATGIQAEIAVLDRGGPLLIGATKPYGAPGTRPQVDYYPVGLADDLGAFVYLPELGHRTGTDDPRILLKWSFIALFSLLLLVYPLVFYELLGSVLAALAAPLLLLYGFRFMYDTDIYWITGWVILLCLPLVMLVYKRWNRWSIAWLALLMLVASFASSIRVNAGLPVLLAAIIVVLLREKRWLVRIGTAALLVAVSLSISSLVMGRINAQRWDALAKPELRSAFSSHHVVWHAMYVGLGYLPNKYGIRWNDQLGFERAERENPGVVLLSKDYDRTMRHLYFRVLEDDPGLVAKNAVYKAAYALGDVGRRFALALVLVPLMLLVGRRRRDTRVFALLTVPALPITLAPLVLAAPDSAYAPGFRATCGLLWLLGICWAIASIPDGVKAWRSDPDAWRRRLAGWRRSPGVVAGRVAASVSFWVLFAVALAAVVGVATLRPEVQAAYADFQLRGSPGISTSELRGSSPVRTLSLPGTGAGDWTSPDLRVGPGSYWAVADGEVARGGLELGVVASGDRQLGVDHYTRNGMAPEATMAVPFAVTKPAIVRVVLSDWGGATSDWVVRRVRLMRRG